MASDTVQQVKDILSIVDVVSGYIKLDRAGRTLRARCPFHAERTPSFFVSPDRGTYHCFGCNVGGDIFSFVMQIEGLDFKGALKVLAEKAGVPIRYSRPREDKDAREKLFELMEAATISYCSFLSKEPLEYLSGRGISDGTIKAFRIGFAGGPPTLGWDEAARHLRKKGFSEKEILDGGLAKRNERGALTDKFRNRIMFPISDSAGRIVGFSGRIFGGQSAARTEDGFEPPKYLNSPETPLYHKSRILYGFDKAKHAIRRHNCAVLVEGQMDLLASHQAGWGNTVAVSGTSFTPEHAASLRRLTDNLVIALDPDEAGIRAAGKAARAAMAAGLNVKVAALPSDLDPADLILKKGADAWRAAIRESKDIITFLLDVLEKHSAPSSAGLSDGASAKAGGGKDRFRRNVESVVLPYLSDVQSPIAREQYIREIAARLSVSEQAVSDAVALLPRQISGSAGESKEKFRESSGAEDGTRIAFAEATAGRPASAEIYERARQAFALLLWQESLPRPELDTRAFAEEFGKIIGEDALGILRNLEEGEKESLRFSAEKLYGKSSGIKGEARILLSAIARDKLAGKLADTTAALRKAEAEGDEKTAENLIKECRVLTSEIAQMH